MSRRPDEDAARRGQRPLAGQFDEVREQLDDLVRLANEALMDGDGALLGGVGAERLLALRAAIAEFARAYDETKRRGILD